MGPRPDRIDSRGGPVQPRRVTEESAMDTNSYVVEKLVAARLAEMRAERARRALVEEAEPRKGLASGLGAALVRLGGWFAPGAPARPNAGVRPTR